MICVLIFGDAHLKMLGVVCQSIIEDVVSSLFRGERNEGKILVGV